MKMKIFKIVILGLLVIALISLSIAISIQSNREYNVNNNLSVDTQLTNRLSITSTPPASGDWVISSGGTYANQSYQINGDVIISASSPVSFFNVSLNMTGSFEIQSSNNYFQNNFIFTNATASSTVIITNVNNNSFIGNTIISPVTSLSITNANQSVLQHNSIKGTFGIYCTSVYYDNLTNNYILATNGAGVVLKNSNFNIVSNNTINNALPTYNGVDNSPIYFQNARNNTISLNNLTANSSVAISSSGDFSTHNNDILNNNIKANGFGIQLYGENNTIGYNKILSTNDGVYFYCVTFGSTNCNTVKSGRNSILGNYNNTSGSAFNSNGIYIDTIVTPDKVINNTIYSHHDGIEIYSANNEIIKGNAINATNYGIDIEQSSFLNVSRNNITSIANGLYLLQANNNTFSNNFINSATNSSNAALTMKSYYTGSTYVDDLYNNFYYNNFTGISLGVWIDFITVNNAPNYFIGNYIHGTGFGAFGVEIFGVNISFTNNTIIGASEGMYLAFGPFFTINNTIIGESSYGIDASGNPGSQIINNSIYSPTTAIHGGSGTITGNIIHIIDIIPPTLVSGTTTAQILEFKSSNILSWTANDLAPDKYSIYLNQTLITSGSWQNSVAVQFNTSKIAVGFYNFTMIFNDTSNNKLTITFNLTIIDSTAPVFSSEPNYNLPVNVGFPQFDLIWVFSDFSNYTYIVYLNGSIIETNYGYGSQNIVTLSVYGLNHGVYNYTIVVNDKYGNNNSSTVFVTVSSSIISNPTPTTTPTTTSSNNSPTTHSANSSGSINNSKSSQLSGFSITIIMIALVGIPLIKKYRS